MFSKEAGMILIILKRSTVMLFREVLWFFPFMNDCYITNYTVKKRFEKQVQHNLKINK